MARGPMQLHRLHRLKAGPAADSNIIRASIDVEPKIRRAEEILISLPSRKTIVSVCTIDVRSYVCLFITRNHLLQKCIILDILFGIVTENVYWLA